MSAAEKLETLSPRMLAIKDYQQGLGLDANPYATGSLEREEYMMEMARMWNVQFQRELEELRAGV